MNLKSDQSLLNLYFKFLHTWALTDLNPDSKCIPEAANFCFANYGRANVFMNSANLSCFNYVDSLERIASIPNLDPIALNTIKGFMITNLQSYPSISNAQNQRIVAAEQISKSLSPVHTVSSAISTQKDLEEEDDELALAISLSLNDTVSPQNDLEKEDDELALALLCRLLTETSDSKLVNIAKYLHN